MIVKRFDSSDNRVFKYVFEFGGKTPAIAEAVAYRYPDWNTRTVICCSVQSGCPIGCAFCGSGGKFIRNLTHQEIIDQVEHILQDHHINHEHVQRFQIMFMSMGEPFLNMPEVLQAIRLLNYEYLHAELLVSTMAPNVPADTWADFVIESSEISEIGLQFSVHASTDEERDKIIPGKHMSLLTIASMGQIWHGMTGRKPFINYCATPQNSTPGDAALLGYIFDPHIFNATVSVVCEADETVKAARDRQCKTASDFASLLVERGFDVRVFDPAGQDDIGGGCGQLWYVQQWMQQNGK